MRQLLAQLGMLTADPLVSIPLELSAGQLFFLGEKLGEITDGMFHSRSKVSQRE